MRQLSPARDRCGGRRGSLTRPWAEAFTLVELMVSLAALLLLTGVSYASFFPLLQAWRLRQAAFELQTQLLQARMVAQKSRASCQVTQTDSATVSFGADSAFSGNGCTTANLPTLSLLSRASGLAVVAGTATTFTFSGNGSLAGSTDAVTILSANGTSFQACLKTTVPAGLIMVGSRLSASDTCNYVRD